jgi:hypothetical protein
MRLFRAAVVVLALTLSASTAHAIPVSYDFEAFADLDDLTNQLAPLGATFTNALVLTAGVSLNEIDFPPVAGSNVISDASGPMTIHFSRAVTSVSGFFTYIAPVTMTAYLGGIAVGSISSSFTENYVTSGNAPNELLALFGLFDEIQLAGGADGGSFVLDMLTADFPEETARVPEPATLPLLALGVAAFWRRRSAQSR